MDLYGRKFENGFMGFDLEVFRLPDSQDVWFIGKDVAEKLEYKDSSTAIYDNVWTQNKWKLFVDDLVIGVSQTPIPKRERFTII